MVSEPKPIPYPAPAGFHWAIAESDKTWRASIYPINKCRAGAGYHHRACGKTPTVLEIRRGRTWWSYCAEHVYSRWIVDGVVYGWSLRLGEETQ